MDPVTVRKFNRLLVRLGYYYDRGNHSWVLRGNPVSTDQIKGAFSAATWTLPFEEDYDEILDVCALPPVEPANKGNRGSYDDTALRAALHEALAIRKLRYDDDLDSFVRDVNPTSALPVPLSDVQEEMSYLAELMAYNGSANKVPSSLMVAMIQDDARLARVNLLAQLVGDTAYQPDEEFRVAYLTAWHRVMQFEQPLDVTICVLSHYHWLVKTHMFGLYKPQAHPLMLGVWGNQGIGKTSVDDGHWRPFLHKYYVPDYTLERLADDRNKPLLGNSFVLNLAELVTANSAEHNKTLKGDSLSLLKSLLTQAEITYRPMQTTSSVTLKVSASVIYSANSHIYDVVQDVTGMRRFFELTSNAPANKHVSLANPGDWHYVMDQANFRRFFTSLNETLDQGYMHDACDSWAYIKDAQAKYIVKTEFQHFLLRYYTPVPDMDPIDGLLTKQILDVYKPYAEAEHIDLRYMPGSRSVLAQAEQLWGLKVIDRKPNDGGDARKVLLLKRNDNVMGQPMQASAAMWVPGMGAPHAPASLPKVHNPLRDLPDIDPDIVY